LFVLRPFSHNILYSFQYTTSYNYTIFTMLVWSHHQWFGYPFPALPMRKWTHCNPWYASRYHASIVLENAVHVQREVSHLFPHHTRKWVDIVITRNKFVDLIHTNLVQCASMMTTHLATIVVQDKTWSYIKWSSRNNFIPLAIEIYDYLHPHFDSFFTSCVHVSIACH
jgi:hypothetical protein